MRKMTKETLSTSLTLLEKIKSTHDEWSFAKLPQCLYPFRVFRVFRG